MLTTFQFVLLCNIITDTLGFVAIEGARSLVGRESDHAFGLELLLEAMLRLQVATHVALLIGAVVAEATLELLVARRVLPVRVGLLADCSMTTKCDES